MSQLHCTAAFENFQQYLRLKLKEKTTGADISITHEGSHQSESGSTSLSVGIVGGGIAGLYSALLLQNYIPGVKVKIFEANSRVGGRIFTHKFSDEPYQYFEAGAMRVPCNSFQQSFFQLVDYLNKMVPTNQIKLLDYKFSCPSGNRVLVNGTKQKDGRIMSVEYAQKHCSELGFPPQANIQDTDVAGQLFADALQPVITALSTDFMAAMDKYSDISLRNYLLKEAGWTEERINYYEVMAAATNLSYAGLVSVTIISLRRHTNSTAQWKTIEDGMCRLPELCAEAVTQRSGEILLNTKVESIQYPDENGTVQLGYVDVTQPSSKELTYNSFDAVIIATPPSCVRMMPERPCWPADMEYALRALHQHPVNKIGLRFKSRFWERSDLQHPPSFGGQSLTDLPSHWIVYPSYGIGDRGKGILIAYSWLADSMHWLPKTSKEKIQLVLRDLQLLYPELDIASEYAGGTDPTSDLFTKEAFIIDWLKEWSTVGALHFYPGQFTSLFPILAQPRGHIYFAGDFLSSVNNMFIAGALESSKRAVQQLVSRHYEDLQVDFL